MCKASVTGPAALRAESKEKKKERKLSSQIDKLTPSGTDMLQCMVTICNRAPCRYYMRWDYCIILDFPAFQLAGLFRSRLILFGADLISNFRLYLGH